MFVFDAADVLTRSDTTFTDGNSGSHGRVRRGSDARFLSSIPFDLVYHDGSFPNDRRDEIVFHRNAEVLVPNSLDIHGPLRFVMVRSEAELQTLLSLLRDLGPRIFSKVRPLCGANLRSASSDLFVRRWTYVESVTVSGRRIVFSFLQTQQLQSLSLRALRFPPLWMAKFLGKGMSQEGDSSDRFRWTFPRHVPISPISWNCSSTNALLFATCIRQVNPSSFSESGGIGQTYRTGTPAVTAGRSRMSISSSSGRSPRRSERVWETPSPPIVMP